LPYRSTDLLVLPKGTFLSICIIIKVKLEVGLDAHRTRQNQYPMMLKMD